MSSGKCREMMAKWAGIRTGGDVVRKNNREAEWYGEGTYRPEAVALAAKRLLEPAPALFSNARVCSSEPKRRLITSLAALQSLPCFNGT